MALGRHFSKALWPHQRAAIKTISRYLSASEASGAALISMPTGTGKTAVIAGAIAATAGEHDHYLVLAPWTGIVDQLRLDLDSRAWDRLGLERPKTFPRVRELPATSQIDDLAAVREPSIFVATIAKIVKVYREIAGDTVRLANSFGHFRAVLVDECHYEPAPTWSEAIRSLGIPTVLLTATPYRNDEKYFLIDRDSRYRYRHESAVEDGFIRSPAFVNVPGPPSDFVDELLRFLQGIPQPDSRVIIRCADADSIRDVVRQLQQRERSVVGIHETFKTGETEGLVKRVPSADECTAQFWVHQFKLVEGIDDLRFRVLAFRDRLGNDRATVQQIGRVLRNPARSSLDTTAWVLSRENFDVEGVWRNYQVFDEKTGESVATTPSLARSMLAVQPDSVYYDGRFRMPVNLDSKDAWKSFAYPMGALIYRLPEAGRRSIEQIASDISTEWIREDRDVRMLQYPDTHTVVIPYVSIGNSDLLLSVAFIEAHFGFTVIRMTDQRLFVFDTEGRTPRVINDNLDKEPRTSLVRLMSGSSRLTTVSLDNTDVSRRSIRARTIRAAAIEELAPDFNDYSFVCSVAEGYPPPVRRGERVRRYLGISRSRIRDRRESGRTFEEYRAWLDEIETVLNDALSQPARTFSRYAQATETPINTSPRHVLIDVDAGEYTRQRDDGSTEPLIMDDRASEVAGGLANLSINGEEMEAQIAWNDERGRYDFDCEPLKRLAFHETHGQRRELVSAINSDQQMRVVPETENYLYANGNFVTLTTPHRDGDQFPLLAVMTGLDVLRKTKSEKGERPVGDGWDPDSVFGVIDTLKVSHNPETPPEISTHFPDIDMLVCTDLGPELADFIACQPGRIAFIHAKFGGGAKRSASVLHDVVGQAVKNLLYLQPLGQEIPPLTSWGEPWSPDKALGSVNRLRTSRQMTAEEMWDHARKVITNPNADREVWLVLGAAMSKTALLEQSRRESPSSELIQIHALLQTAWSAISQCGARLRVFCSP